MADRGINKERYIVAYIHKPVDILIYSFGGLSYYLVKVWKACLVSHLLLGFPQFLSFLFIENTLIFITHDLMFSIEHRADKYSGVFSRLSADLRLAKFKYFLFPIKF